MGDPVRRRATYEDLLAVPEGKIAELIDGVLHTNPRPAAPHAVASSVLGMEIGSPFSRGRGGPGGWVILDEPELHLHGDVLVPDLAGWRRERMPQVPDAAAFELAPDWVGEVLSTSTAAVDRVKKMPIYAREGVEHLWLVDPLLRTLEAYRRVEMQWLSLGTWSEGGDVRIEPFDAVAWPLDALWGR
jgi:Uma2 family endonuclease